MAEAKKGQKRKLDETEEAVLQSTLDTLGKRKDEARHAEDILKNKQVLVRDWEELARPLVVKKALTEQLRKCWNTKRCILCKKEVGYEGFDAVPKCGCEWHDHDYNHTDTHKARSFKWVSVVPKNTCMVCRFPSLMPWGGGLVKRLNFTD